MRDAPAVAADCHWFSDTARVLASPLGNAATTLFWYFCFERTAASPGASVTLAIPEVTSDVAPDNLVSHLLVPSVGLTRVILSSLSHRTLHLNLIAPFKPTLTLRQPGG